MPAPEAQSLEDRSTLPIGPLHQRAAVEVQQVEDRVHDRRAGSQPPHGGRRGHVHAPLEAPEAGPSRLVERDDLAVEHRLMHPDIADEPANLGI